MKQPTILVTGSAGKSGKAIIERLANQYTIIGLDLHQSPYTTLVGSLADWELVQEATQNVDAIIHTASLHAPHVANHSREAFLDTNIKGTLYLLEAAKRNKVRKFVYTSTTSVYGEQMDNPDQAVWITEEVHPIARDIYDITKLTAEELCKDFFDVNTLQTVSLRVSRFWDEPLDKKVFYRMYRGVDVRDVAFAHQLALKTHFDRFDVFNISAQSIFEFSDLTDLRKNLYTLLEKKYPAIIAFFNTQGWPLPEFIDRVYVIDKAKQRLGYHPTHNIDAMLDTLNGNTFLSHRID